MYWCTRGPLLSFCPKCSVCLNVAAVHVGKVVDIRYHQDSGVERVKQVVNIGDDEKG